MSKTNATKCYYCDKIVNDNHGYDCIDVCRKVLNPHSIPNEETIALRLPLCKDCCSKMYPLSDTFRRIQMVSAIIVVICVLFSAIQRNIFALSFFSGLIFVLVASFFGLVLVVSGYLFTEMSFDDEFKPSMKKEPYKSLPVIKYLESNGFVDKDERVYKKVDPSASDYKTVVYLRKYIKEEFRV